jgi:hypothetical protein
VKQDFRKTFEIWAVGFVVALLLTLFSWPCLFRRHPVKFLQSLPEPEPQTAQNTNSKKKQ